MGVWWAAKPPIHEAPVQPPVAAQDDPIAATMPPPRLSHDETRRLQRAAHEATLRWPNPIGDLVERELRSWAELGCAYDSDGLMARVVRHLLD